MTAYQNYFTRPVIKFINIIWVTRVKGTSAGVFEILLKIDLPNIIFYWSFKTLTSGFLFTIIFLRDPYCLPTTYAVYPRSALFTGDPYCLPATRDPRPARIRQSRWYRGGFIQSKWYIELTIFIFSRSRLEKIKEQSSFDYA